MTRSSSRSVRSRPAPRIRRLVASIVAAGAALALAACTGTTSPATTATAPPDASDIELSGSITLFAAASLTATFTELADEFMAALPGTRVTLTFAGSSDLVTQITEGAPADVFASADEPNMQKLTDAGLIDPADPIPFATNVLTIAVPPGNPAGVASFADLAKPDVATVVCAPQVPCGRATEAIEQSTGVTLMPVSEESSVTDVLGKVSSGEADAGLVYVTDVKGAGGAVEGIDFAESANAVNVYPIAPVSASQNPALAAAFVGFVTSPSGRAVLDAAGFGAP